MAADERPRTMKQRGRAALSTGAVALVLAASLAACGGDDSSSDKTTAGASTTATQATTPAEPADNGIAEQSADEILAASTEAAKGASAVHVSGAMEDVELDLSLVKGEGASGSMSQGPNEFEILAVDDSVYLKGSNDFYRQLGGEAAVQLLGDRWLKAPASGEDFASFAQLTDMDQLLDEVLSPDGTITKGEVETVDGQDAVPLKSSDGDGTLYVAATGEPLPLQIVGDGDRGKIVFDGWNEPAELTAPTDAVDVSELERQNG